MNPRPSFSSFLANIVSRVKCPGIHIPSLNAYDCCAFDFWNQVCTHPSLIIHRHTNNSIPDEAGFDDDTYLLVANNQLMAMEASWVGEYTVRVSGDWGTWSRDLSRLYPTDDLTLRWVLDAYFHSTAINEASEVAGRGPPHRFLNYTLRETIQEIGEWVRKPDMHYAFGLFYNGNQELFVSDILGGPEFLPDERWGVSRDYSGTADDNRLGRLPYEAEVRFTIWNAHPE